MLRSICISLAAALALAGAAFAQSPTGDWQAKLAMPTGSIDVGFHIDETTPGVFTGAIRQRGSDNSAALADIKSDAGALSFTVPSIKASFAGKWDAASSSWTGDYKAAGRTFTTRFTKGALAPYPVIAGIDGLWTGKVSVSGLSLRIHITIETGKLGTVAMLASPDQGPGQIPASDLALKDGVVSFAVPTINASYSGRLSADGAAISGTFTQGAAMPLDLVRTTMEAAAASEPKRPQLPAKPYPYREVEVSFDNPKAPGVRLAGTLTLPEGKGPFPAAVMLSGSGAQDRDETLMGHKPFLVIADQLTRNGIAVLRFDDRGTAKSTGDFDSADVRDLASDGEAALAFLRTQKDIDKKRIGLIGHSEGGMTGPIIAAKDRNVAFVVMLAGIGVKGGDLYVEQQQAIVRSMGGGDAALAANKLFWRGAVDAMIAAPDSDVVAALMRERLKAAGTPEGPSLETAAQTYASPWFRSFLAYDPATTLPRIRAPILAINGSRDIQVIAASNLAGVKALTAKNKDVTTVELPGLNHLFQTARTGTLAEYGELEETFAPVALATVSDWLVKRVKK